MPTVQPNEGNFGFSFWPEGLRKAGYRRWKAAGYPVELPDPYKLMEENIHWRNAMYLYHDLDQIVNKKSPMWGLVGELSAEEKARLIARQEQEEREANEDEEI